MNLLPKKNAIIKAFFHKYMLFKVTKHFQKIVFYPVSKLSTNQSLLIISNHHSWWDGFLLYYINHYYLHKKFHLVVNEKNYLQHQWFKYLGAIGIAEKPREKLQSLAYCQSILKHPKNALCIFPQGKLFSQHVQKLELKSGWTKLNIAECQVIFLHQFTDYFDYPKPSLYIYTGIFDDSIPLKEAYQKSYDAAKLMHTQLCK